MTRTALLIPLLGVAAACGTPDRTGMTELSAAARIGDTRRIAALVASGHDVNARDPGLNHWTPLLHAIHKGQRTAVDALVTAGADVNRTGPHGLSPLEMAAGNGQADIVRPLLAAGADPREPGVFTAAVSGGALMDIEQPLFGRCNTEVVQALLRRAPELRLPRNGPGHLARTFAWLNRCDGVLQMTAFVERAPRGGSD